MQTHRHNTMTILIVDDDPSITASLAMLLKQHGYNTLQAGNPQQANDLLCQHTISLVLQDMNFSRNTCGDEGMVLLKQIKNNDPTIPVILMTAWGSIELAVDGIKNGAADFVTKPWKNQQLLRIIETSLELSQASTKAIFNRKELDEQFDFSNIIGEDPRLVEILTTIGRVTATDAPVLILGESGTGKELIADAVHNNSKRREKLSVKVNLGGMNTSLFESEMFGHVKGAFTDAKQDRKGRFEMADESTIFLDEIGDLDPASQVKLLRVLQDQTFQAVGSSQTRKVNVRIISATNRDLEAMVTEGNFREDLLYRLNLITIQLPSLKERRGDIRLLAKSHLHRVQQLYGIHDATIDETAYHWLEQQNWPGNIRQLSQTIERALLMSGTNRLTAANFLSPSETQMNTGFDDTVIPVGSLTLNEMEKLMIKKALKAYNKNISKVAEALGISRAALYRRLEKYGLDS